MSNVIQFPEPPPEAHLTCRCGNVWWQPRGVVIDDADQHVTGYAYPITCIECGQEWTP